MGELTSIWKDRGVTMETKVKLVTVFGVPDCFLRSGDLDNEKT